MRRHSRTATLLGLLAVLLLALALPGSARPHEGFQLSGAEQDVLHDVVVAGYNLADYGLSDCTGGGTVGTSIDWGDTSSSPGTIVAGTGDFACLVEGTHLYGDEGRYDVVTSITVSHFLTYQVPAVAFIQDADFLTADGLTLTATEGTPFSGELARFGDANTSPNDAFDVSIDWGDGTTTAGTFTLGSLGDFTADGTHTWADEGTYDVHVTLTDRNGTATATADTVVTVGDADALDPIDTRARATEGAQFSGQMAGFTDAHWNDPADFSATIDWGDGTATSAGTVSGQGGEYGVSGAHVYAEEGTYDVTTTVTDPGGTATATLHSTMVVDDAALTAQGTSLTVKPTVAFTAAVASFGDADPAGTVGDYTATIDWGDGSPLAAGTIAAHPGGGFDVTATHAYAARGTYVVTVHVADAGGSGTTATTTIVAPVADLQASIGAAPNPVKTQTNLTYSIVVQNNGPDAAANLVLADQLPSGSQFVSLTAPPGLACQAPAAGTTGTLTCSLASLASGASATLAVVVKVTQLAKSTVASSVSVTSDTFDPNPADNEARVRTSVFGRH